MPTNGADEFVRGPKWRTRTTASRRHRAAAVTFAVVVAVGAVLLWAVAWSLSSLGAGGVLLFLIWAVPTAVVVAWTVLHPTPARLSDDDDDSWFGYSIRWALVGELGRRPLPVRVLVAALAGAPLGWALALVALLTLLGIA